MKKGFTLIELLAVIVILAVLALIATPIVLNIIDDSKKNATLRSSENYIKAIEFSIAKSVMENKRLNDGTYPIMTNGSICLGTLSGSTCDNELVVEVSGETPESGTVTIKSRKIDSYEFTYASGFVVINGEINSGETTMACKLSDSTLEYKNDIGNGKMVTCGEERFYVIEENNSDNTFTLFAEKNITLSLTNPVQSDDAELIAFSETPYWGEEDEDYGYFLSYDEYYNNNGYIYNSNSNLYVYVEAYKNSLIDSGLDIKSARIPRVEDLGYGWDEFWQLFSYYDESEFATWVNNDNFWIGQFSPEGGQDDLVYNASNYGGTDCDYHHGIRPIIIISKDSVRG